MNGILVYEFLKEGEKVGIKIFYLFAGIRVKLKF